MPIKQLPLKPFNSVFKSAIHSVGDYHYACLVLNAGSTNEAYDYKEPTFKFHSMTGTGWVDGDKVWYLSTVPNDENGKLFSLDVKIDSKTNNETLTKEAIANWEKSNRLIAIDCKNIPSLGALAKVLHERKEMIRGDLSVKIGCSADEASKLEGHLNTFFDFFRENKRFQQSKRGEDVSCVAAVSSNLGVPNLLFDEPGHGLPQVDEIDTATGLPTGDKVFLSVPFEGEFGAITKFLFDPPEATKSNGSGWKSGGGANVSVEAYTGKSGWEFIKSNHDEITQFFKSRYSIPDADLIGIVLSVAGVNTLPAIHSAIAKVAVHEPLLMTKDSTNGHVPKVESATIPNAIAELAIPKVDTAELMAVQLKELMKKPKSEGGLELDEDSIQRWFAIHEGNIADVPLLHTILDSEAWKKERDAICAWSSKSELGFANTDIPPTVLKAGSLSKLHRIIETYDHRIKIDQSTTFNEAVVSCA